MCKLTFILAINYKSYIWIELSLEERDAKADGFQQQYIVQLMHLKKRNKAQKEFAREHGRGKTINTVGY